MQLRFGLPLALSALSLVGCSAIGIDNGSLDYKKSTAQAPLKYPEGAMVRPATPLYPAPVVEQLAIDNAPNLENDRGNRFELPRPAVTQTITPSIESAQETPMSRPQLLTDGNGNPLIKIDGNSATIWQYTIATLSSLNHTVVGQAKNTNEITIKIDGQNLVLKLTSVGSSNTLAVYNPNNTFAEKSKAVDLLTQIYQNWPA
jgi:uncharacterized lipoprotein